MRLFSFLLAAFVLTNFANAQSAVPTADEVLKPVYAKAAARNKKVLLIFHASWCGWCRKMDASLADDAIKPLIDKNFEIAHLTVYESPTKTQLENPGALEFLAKHGGGEQGLPYWFVLDKNGNVLADSQYQPKKNTGCPASEEEVAYFITVLKKTTTLKDAELDTIKKRFRKNEL
jgi:thiol-disulfide isomerase/thioredoxin